MGAIFVERSNNHKIGGTYAKGEPKVCTTYTSIKATCPRDCELFNTRECYGMYGHTGIHVRKLDEDIGPRDGLRIACEEAEAIDLSFKGGKIPQDGVKGGRDLRLHTVGDCKTNAAAKVLAGATKRWKARGGGDVWTYTHSWKKIHKASWGGISVLASIDRVSEGVMAVNAGYAPARYIADFPNGTKAWKEKGITWIPCKAQVNDEMTCVLCRLCMKADKLFDKKMGVAFKAHGRKEKQLKARLEG